MVVPRRRNRVSRMLLIRRGLRKTAPVRPGKILDLSALCEVPRSKAMAEQEHFTARDSHLVHNMERILQSQATRPSRPRERAQLQGRGVCTPMQHTKSNAMKSEQNMAGKRSRASSGGYPSTWILDEKPPNSDCSFNQVTKCCSLNHHRLTTPTRRMHMPKTKDRPAGTQTMTNNLLAKQPKPTTMSGAMRNHVHMKGGGMNRRYENKKLPKNQSYHTGERYTSSDASFICLCPTSGTSEYCSSMEELPAKYMNIERISYPPDSNYAYNSDEEREQMMHNQEAEKVSRKMYGRERGEMRPKMYGRERGEMSPKMHSRERGEMSPRERGEMSPKVYSRDRGEMSPKMYDRERGEMNPKRHSRERGEMSPKMYDRERGEMSPKMYGRERGELSPRERGEMSPRMVNRDKGMMNPQRVSRERDMMSPQMYYKEKRERETIKSQINSPAREDIYPKINSREKEERKSKRYSRERGEKSTKVNSTAGEEKKSKMYSGERNEKPSIYSIEREKIKHKVNNREFKPKERDRNVNKYTGHRRLQLPNQTEIRRYIRDDPDVCLRVCQNTQRREGSSPFFPRKDDKLTMKNPAKAHPQKTSTSCCRNRRICKQGCPMAQAESNRSSHSSKSYNSVRQSSGASSMDFSKNVDIYKKKGQTTKKSEKYSSAQGNPIEKQSSTVSFQMTPIDIESLGDNKKKLSNSSKAGPVKVKCTKVRISNKEVQTHCLCPNCGIEIAPTVDDNISEKEFNAFDPPSLLSSKETSSRINTSEHSVTKSPLNYEEDKKIQQKQENKPKKANKAQKGEKKEDKGKKYPTCFPDGSDFDPADHTQCSQYNMDQLINILHETVAGLKKRKNIRDAENTQPASRGNTVNNQRMHRAHGQGLPKEFVPFDEYNQQMKGFVPQQPYNAFNPYGVQYNSYQQHNMNNMQMPKVHSQTGNNVGILKEPHYGYPMGNEQQQQQQQQPQQQHQPQQQQKPQHQPQQQQQHQQPQQQQQHQQQQQQQHQPQQQQQHQQQQPQLLQQQHDFNNHNYVDNTKKVTNYNSYNNNPTELNSETFAPINKDLRRKPSGSTYPIGDTSSRAPQFSYSEMQHKTLQKLNPTESFIQFFDMAISLRNNQKEKRNIDDKESSWPLVYQPQQKLKKMECAEKSSDPRGRKREIREIESMKMLDKNRLPAKEKHEAASEGKRSFRTRLRKVLKNVNPRKKLSTIPNRLLYERDIEKERKCTQHQFLVHSEVYGSHQRRESNEHAEISKQTRTQRPCRVSSHCRLTLSEEGTIETEDSGYAVKYSYPNKADKPIPPPKPLPCTYLYRKQHDKRHDSSSQKTSETELKSYLEKEKGICKDKYLAKQPKTQDLDSTGKTKKRSPELKLQNLNEQIRQSLLIHSSSSNGIIKEEKHPPHKLKAIEDKSSLYPSCKKQESNSSDHKTRRKKSNSLHSKIFESKLSVDNSQEQIRFNKETRESEESHKNKQKSSSLLSHPKRSKNENKEPSVGLDKETSVFSNREQKLKESSSLKTLKGRCKTGWSHRGNHELYGDDEIKVIYDSSYKFVKQKEVDKSTKKKCEYKYHTESENRKRLKPHPSESRNNFFKMLR